MSWHGMEDGSEEKTAAVFQFLIGNVLAKKLSSLKEMIPMFQFLIGNVLAPLTRMEG